MRNCLKAIFITLLLILQASSMFAQKNYSKDTITLNQIQFYLNDEFMKNIDSTKQLIDNGKKIISKDTLAYLPWHFQFYIFETRYLFTQKKINEANVVLQKAYKLNYNNSEGDFAQYAYWKAKILTSQNVALNIDSFFNIFIEEQEGNFATITTGKLFCLKGNILKEQQLLDEADSAYFEGLKYAELTQNNNLFYNLYYGLSSSSVFKNDERNCVLYANKMIEYAQLLKHPSKITKSKFLLALAYSLVNNKEKALDLYFSILLEYEKSKDYTNMGLVENNIGNIYQDALKYDTSNIYIFKAIENMKKVISIDNNGGSNFAKPYYNLGFNFYQLKQYDKSLYYYNLSNEIALKEKDKVMEASLHYKVANVYAAKNNPKKANDEYLIAIDQCKKLDADYILAECYVYYGRFLTNEKKYESSLDFLNKSLQLANKIQSNSAIMKSYTALEDYYLATQNYKLAHHFLTIEKALEDSINKSEKSLNFDIEKSVYELEKSKIENQIKIKTLSLKNELQQKQSNTKLLILTLISFFILAIAVFYRQQTIQKQKFNAHLEHLNKQLNEKNTLINHQINDLSSSNQNLQNFASNAAHDLKGPLTSINSVAMLFKYQLEKAPLENKNELLGPVNYIFIETQKLSSMIDDLLKLSNINKNLPPAVEVNLTHIIHDVKDALQKNIQEKNALIEHNEFVNIMAHESLMRILFQNLIINAIKYKHPDKNPIIQINQTINKENKFVYSVQDNGLGIAEKDFDKIFESFKKLDHQSDGSGIGLALCKKIVEFYHGKIWLESSENNGTTFYFTLS